MDQPISLALVAGIPPSPIHLASSSPHHLLLYESDGYHTSTGAPHPLTPLDNTLLSSLLSKRRTCPASSAPLTNVTAANHPLFPAESSISQKNRTRIYSLYDDGNTANLNSFLSLLKTRDGGRSSLITSFASLSLSLSLAIFHLRRRHPTFFCSLSFSPSPIVFAFCFVGFFFFPKS